MVVYLYIRVLHGCISSHSGCLGFCMVVAVRIRDVWAPHGCSSSHTGYFGFYMVVALHIRDVSGATRL